MDLRVLRYFVTVADELNMTRAAEKLHMSQPPLSYEIRRLEKDLGARLFFRRSRGLELTDEGHAYYRRACQMLSLAAVARDEVASMKRELAGKVCLGLVDGHCTYLAAEWIAEFHQSNPRVRFSLWNGSSDDILDRLNSGLLDLALIAAPYDHELLDGFVVGEEPWVAMIPSGHRLAGWHGNEVPLRELASELLIVPERPSRVEGIYRWFRNVGREPMILCTTSNYADSVSLTERGAGISIFPLTTLTPNPRLVKKVITHPTKLARYLLVWEKRQPPHGAAKRLVDFVLKSVTPESIGFGMTGYRPETTASLVGADLL